MPDDPCPVCGLHHLGRRPCYYDRLRAALGGLEPSEAEDRILRWLAKWDDSTIEPIISLFDRLRSRGAK